MIYCGRPEFSITMHVHDNSSGVGHYSASRKSSPPAPITIAHRNAPPTSEHSEFVAAPKRCLKYVNQFAGPPRLASSPHRAK